VTSHVKHILAKLGFSSRSQVAAWVTEQRTGSQQVGVLLRLAGTEIAHEEDS
jgi:hypothetical protein